MYFTFKTKQTQFQQIDLEALFRNPALIAQGITPPHEILHTRTIERELEDLPQNWERKYGIEAKAQSLIQLLPEIQTLQAEDRNSLYYSFHIPKRSGGLRQIDAPKGPLMELLYKVKNVFDYELFALAHEAAYAYVPTRSPKDALEVHQKNESRWFLKLDIKDFFPSCNPEFIEKQLKQIFPFTALYESPSTANALHQIVDICTLNNKLPQGTPMSPLLTNLIMLPMDHAITNALQNFNKQHYKYTRYADDILISSKYNFDPTKLENLINSIFRQFSAPFQIKKEKTRYGSSAGRNWNLGLMLNKDNNITIGYRNKKKLKAMLFSFLIDFTKGNPWSIIDTQVMSGTISYYHQIEPEYVEQMITKYEQEFGTNFKSAVKSIIA